ncbi:MAG: metallophosphoesterase [Clostridiales bacterium]|nr:metallophosphoesterase [Clostridiales bacterium]MDY3763203.1 metallophosphoesterase [Candidatus Ventricola sp.]MDY3831609.1 metallophosphoesterase [Candidatus Ventricola sp.]MDY4855026.1 metallophosphoesterase [Candidatus Ventricola sp.]
MRVGVFSDSHGDHEALDELLERMGALDAVCFLGDVARDAEHLRERLAAMPNQPVLYAVRGNNDYYSTCTLPWDLLIELGGVRIYMTHGHRLVSLMNLAYKAQECGAQVALFGHTHQALCETVQGVLLLNPGSAGNFCRGGRARASVLEINRGCCSVTNYLL